MAVKGITCTANSLANIDYKKPTLFTQKDYRTSTGSYHRHIPSPIHIEYYSDKPKIAAFGLERNNSLQAQTYKTTSGIAYIKRYGRPKINEVANTAARCNDTFYVTNIKEKMYKNPPMPMKLSISEYHEAYVPKEASDIYYTPLFLYCKLQSNGTDEQPRTIVEQGGTYKLLDPYVTTTRLTHYPFTQDQQKWASGKNIPTLWTALEHPHARPVPKEPVYDPLLFKRPIRSRIVPQITCPVPHLGNTSEYKGRYKPLTMHPMWDKIVTDDNHYEDSLSGPNKLMTQCAPGMYCTEKCHLGTDWGPDRVVNPRSLHHRKVLYHQVPPSCIGMAI